MSRMTSVSRSGEGRSAIAARRRSPSSSAMSAASGSGASFGKARVDRVEVGRVAGVGEVLRAVFRHPGDRGVAHDREKPGFRALDCRRLQRLQRPDRRLLHDVLRVGAVAGRSIWRAYRRRRAAAARFRETAFAQSCRRRGSVMRTAACPRVIPGGPKGSTGNPARCRALRGSDPGFPIGPPMRPSGMTAQGQHSYFARSLRYAMTSARSCGDVADGRTS